MTVEERKELLDRLGTWKGEDVYNETKNRLSIYNWAWGMYSGSDKIGNCSTLCSSLESKSVEDFYNKYIEDGDDTLIYNTYYRGRTVNQLYILSKEYKRMAESRGGPKFPIEDYFNNVICHAITETFSGLRMERQVVDYLIGQGFRVESAKGNEDTQMNIDLKVYSKRNNDKLLMLIQVKPQTTFKGNNNDDLKTDRRYFFDKQAIGSELFNVPYIYLIYSSLTEEWLYRTTEYGTKRFTFTLEELVNRETGETLVDIESFPRQINLESK